MLILINGLFSYRKKFFHSFLSNYTSHFIFLRIRLNADNSTLLLILFGVLPADFYVWSGFWKELKTDKI